MSVTPAGPGSRVGRNYTQGRTHPWALGKLGDFVLWFGPYNAGQLIIAAVGVLVLIKTFDWWSGLGPIPVLALGVLVWAARAQRVGGRAPMWVLYGLARRALQPKAGRIGGRTARPPRTHHLTGTVLIEHTTEQTEPVACGGAEDQPARWGRPVGAGPAVPAFASVSARASARAGGGPAPTPLQQMLHDRSKTEAATR
ncbi:hypothetical protein ACH4A8_37500 [Streptomyces vietnamensis]|uniref:hypothetical protein n=1 Tax=Streptomyces vietnamensis TaxID=362257 RepID=UPI0037A35DC4